VSTTGGTDEDVQIRTGKARAAFITLTIIWKSRVITKATKLRIFSSNVRSVLLYLSKTWRRGHQKPH